MLILRAREGIAVCLLVTFFCRVVYLCPAGGQHPRCLARTPIPSLPLARGALRPPVLRASLLRGFEGFGKDIQECIRLFLGDDEWRDNPDDLVVLTGGNQKGSEFLRSAQHLLDCLRIW